MSKKTVKSKMKYMKITPEGTPIMDMKGFQSLKDEQTIFCYNAQDTNHKQLEFFCCICNRNFRGLRACETHWTNSKHKKSLHGYESKIKHSKLVRKLTLAEDQELSQVLIRTAEQNLMSENDFVERQKVCRDFEETIKAAGIYDVSCKLFGSSVTRVGFSDANVNIDILYDIEKISQVISHITDVPLFLCYIYSITKKSDKFCDVVDLFHTSTPKFTFTHVESGLHCIVCPHYKPGVRTSMLIMEYLSMDERVKVLCVAFRKWAKVCGLDDTGGGSMSPYCFTLMMIHYLQQVDPPVLPIINLQKSPYLPNGISSKNEKNIIGTDQIETWKSKNLSTVGRLWVGLFRYYFVDFFFKTLVVNITQSSPMTKNLRGMNSRRISIEDPFFVKDNAAGTLTSSEVMDYFNSSFEKSYKYFSGCEIIEKGDKKIEANTSGKKSERKKKDERKRSKDTSDPKGQIVDKDGEDDDSKQRNENPQNTDIFFSSDDENANDINEKELADDSDSNDDSPDEDVESEDENEVYVNGDNDLLNDDDSSGVEIEEEYIEKNDGDLEKVDMEVVDLETREAIDEGLPTSLTSNELDCVASTETDVTSAETEETDGDSQNSRNDIRYCSTDEGHSNRVSKDYDSQYDGDVDSQAEEDTKQDMDENDDVYLKDNENETQFEIQFSESENISENLQEDVCVKMDPLISDRDDLHKKENDAQKADVDAQLNMDNLSIREPLSDMVVRDLLESLVQTVSHEKDGIHMNVNSETKLTGEDILEVKESDNSKMKDGTKFVFLRKFLAPLRTIPIYCKICAQDGHRRSDCETIDLGEIEPLEIPTKGLLDMLDRLCERIMLDNELTYTEKEQRTRILHEMERHLKKHLTHTARLSLFGSSVNMFGSRGSDLDICLTFGHGESPPGLDHAQMVVKVSRALDKHEDFIKVMYIKSAKVPIVKFVIRNLNLEGDISLYNCLALNNSQMLRAYASIDRRVRILGYCAKVFAKVCEMGDASRGSLSSYAYTLLTLNYLQRCDPPVIPVLQELYDHSKDKPSLVIEGWNTWYWDDINNLAKVWPGYGKNKQTVGELWLGFLRFYVEKFDFARNVVAMRQKNTLSKFQKGWTHASMCIEDPFNLQHNLAAGISRNMYKYILGCFKQARLHFNTAHPHFRKNSSADSLKQYFFSRNHLTENKHVPTDRLCHRCGRIGHTAANCAEKIVADRERRRLDSERTYSSDNGDSDANQNSKGKKSNSMDHIECYGCHKFGHRVANCPQKAKFNKEQRNHSNRNRRDSDRKGEQQSNRIGQEQFNPIGIQTATDMHPMENIDIVLGRSEMTTKLQMKDDNQMFRNNEGKKLRTKADNIETVNSLFSTPPPPKKSVEEKYGHMFSNAIIDLNSLQASVDRVSFLSPQQESPTDKPALVSPNSRRRRISPLKGSRRVGGATNNPNHTKAKDFPGLNNQNDFPVLLSSPDNRKNEQFPSLMNPPDGFQPISATIQGNTTWLPKSSDHKFIGQAAVFNRMQSPGQSPSENSPLNIQNFRQPPPGFQTGNMMNPMPNMQGFHFAQPSMSRMMPGTSPQNQPVVPNYISNKPHQQKGQTPIKSAPGLSLNFNQNPGHVDSRSYTKQNRNNERTPNKDNSSFAFDNFAKSFEKANSPPKGGKEFQYGSSPEKGSNKNGFKKMMYDEEYPSAKNSTPNKKDKRKQKKGKPS